MVATRRLMVAGLFAVVAMLAIAMPASAHATHYSPDGKIKFVYGNLNEPAYTFTKTGLDLSILDNATGKGIAGLDTDARANEEGGETSAPKIFVSLRYGAEGGPTKNISTDFRAQHGSVGKYTHPITYTRAGLYYVLITGNINGTQLNNFALAPAHGIEPLDESMWPDEGGDPNERIEVLEKRVVELEGKEGGAAPSIGPLVLLTAIAIIAAFVRRR